MSLKATDLSNTTPDERCLISYLKIFELAYSSRFSAFPKKNKFLISVVSNLLNFLCNSKISTKKATY